MKKDNKNSKAGIILVVSLGDRRMKSIRDKISFLADCARDVFSLFVALIFVVPIAGIASFAIGLATSSFLIGFVLFTSLIAFSLVALSRN